MMTEDEMKQAGIKHPITEQSVVVEGITADYVWYQSKVLMSKMDTWKYEFERVVRVMEAQRGENMSMIENLLRENAALRAKLKENT